MCPADFDLGENLKIMIFSVVEGAEKPQKYPVMFHAADAVLLNKIDLLPYLDLSLDTLIQNVREINPKAAIFPISCKSGEGIDDFNNWLIEKIETI